MGNQHLVFERYLWFDAEIRKNRYPNATSLAEEFEISNRQARRNIDFMRYSLEAPLVYDPARRGYAYESEFSLPELPLGQRETLAVLLAGNLLEASDSGYISKAIQRFGRRLFQEHSEIGISERRIRKCFSAIWHGHAPCRGAVFRHVSRALLTSRLLSITYHSPLNDRVSRRYIEPHHLQHYMGSWVLLAWCRLRHDWRRFYLSRMSHATPLEEVFTRRSPSAWRPLLYRGFGIFQAAEVFPVRILFFPHIARWVREQIWHPDQEMEEQADGSLVLTVPVADLREIKMKVLQFGAEARVLEPSELRTLIRQEARRLVDLYDRGESPGEIKK